MQFLSNGARFVRLVVPVISLFSSVLDYLFSYLRWYYLPPICATSCCGVSPVCVFSVWNAKCFINFQFFYDWFQQFPVLFDWFQHFPVLFNWFQHYPVFWPGSVFSLSFSLGPFYKKCTCYTCNTSSAFSLYLCDLLCNFVPFWQGCMIYLGETLISLTL